MTDQFKPVAYIKEGCPYSMALLSFIDDAHLRDRVDLVQCAAGTPTMDAVKQKLTDATGEPAKFPTLEIEPGVFKTESKDLIRYLGKRYGDTRH